MLAATPVAKRSLHGPRIVLRTLFGRTPTECVWRAFWLVMFIGHTPGWLAASLPSDATADGGSWLRWSLLTASQILFLLKAIDCPWLRLPRSQRVTLTLSLIVLLLHADVVRRAAAGEFERSLAAPAVVVSIAVVAGAVLGHLAERVVARSGQRHLRHRVRTAIRDLFARLARALRPPRDLALACAARVDRAPPR
jgi:hypothetical protein